MIHMKGQALFPLKKNKKNRLLSAQFDLAL